ncbi:phage tail tube protein [Roseibium sp. MB-4]
MSAQARIGHGTSFQRSGDGTAGGVFASLAGVMAISGPGLSRDAVDVTDMASLGGWREFAGGLKDPGEVSLDLEFDPDGPDVTSLLADIHEDTPGYYKIVFPDTTEWGFPAFVTGYEPTAPLDDKMTASVTFKLSGQPAFIA